MTNVLFWRSIDGQEKSSGFVLRTFLFSFRTAKQNRIDSSGIRNPLYFYFVEMNKKNLADSGFHWNMAGSSGFQWNRSDANALLQFAPFRVEANTPTSFLLSIWPQNEDT
jgi:hypothetical protein